jgi:hypothetical protein
MLFSSPFCFAFLVGSVHALGLLIDATCEGKNLIAVQTALEEAILMATLANTQLASSTDTDFANVYQRIFSTEKSDLPSLAQVTSELNQLLLTF